MLKEKAFLGTLKVIIICILYVLYFVCVSYVCSSISCPHVFVVALIEVTQRCILGSTLVPVLFPALCCFAFVYYLTARSSAV